MWNSEHRRPAVRRRCSGMTLTDLMIGLALGLLVALAALSTLTSTQLAATALDDSVRLQQRADDAFHLIGVQVTQAGAIRLSDSKTNSAQVTFSSAFQGFAPGVTNAPSNGQIVSIYGLENTQNGSDTLRLTNQHNGNRRDCLGYLPQNSDPSTQIRSEFTVSANWLRCKGRVSGGGQPLAEGVKDFQVRYGVQTATALGPQFRFLDANQVSDWSNIQAVSVCLELAGESAGHPAPTIPLVGCRQQSLSANGHLRRVYRRIFSVRNALP